MADNTHNSHRQIEAHEECFQKIEERLNQLDLLTDMVRTLVTNQNTQNHRKLQLKGEGDQRLNEGGFSKVELD